MPLKANVGISRKAADNNYGSRGASVNLEVELDSSLIQEPERLQERIRHVFRLAQQSVDEELARQNSANGRVNGHANGQTHAASPAQPGATANARPQNGNGNGSGHGQVASEKQMTYLRQLAKQVEGLGVRRLETLAQKLFNKPMAALTSFDASSLIDTLKAIKAGDLNLDNALNGAAT